MMILMDEYISQDYIYHDEPLRLSPERLKQMTPPQYRAMRSLDYDSPFSYKNDAQIFYLQAKYMEQFEDDYAYDGTFFSYFPTYRSMKLPELRGYFSWRTRLRHGEILPVSESYAFLYIYELLHGIGSTDPAEGLQKLISFHETYGEIDKHIRKYTPDWIKDYAIYYHVDPALIRDYSDVDFDMALTVLLDCEHREDTAVFEAISRISSYRIEKSKLLRRFPEKTIRTISEAYRQMDRYYRSLQGKSYVEKMYGKPYRMQFTPFRSSVFFDHIHYDHYTYEISPIQKYFCIDHKWYMEKHYTSAKKSKMLGEFMRAADRLLRLEYGVLPALKVDLETDLMHNCIK
ncbi:MAG: TerB N-terminal domain-containing protein, partial [Eubacteriales bacterium]|nr:TerB N-terminal domain-containing protein [Eubacteriales bacterium]